MQKEQKWHQGGRSNPRHHWAKPKVGNIARSFLWGSMGISVLASQPSMTQIKPLR